MNKILCLITLLICQSFATGALSAQIGGLHILQKGEDHSAHLDFKGTFFYAWDQMVLMGLSSGFQQIGNQKSYPTTADLFIRLPIGSVVLPVATADWGYSFGAANAFIWRVGGGFDLKLGDSSSIIGLCGMQNDFDSKTNSPLFWRTGLLLEF